MRKHIQRIILATVALVLTVTCTKSPAGTLTTPYTNPEHFTRVPFGAHSHWLQPWRAYSETVPAITFFEGIGINGLGSSSVNQELIAQMLAKNGIRRVRLEISWNHLDFDDETKIASSSAANFRNQLLALKKYKIRPLILVNSHHGQPCPTKFVERLLAVDARAGDSTVQLNDTSGLKAGYSGLSYLDNDKAAGWIFTKISGNILTLSKPLSKDMKAGTNVIIATLKYRPFSPPDTEDYKTTMTAWQNYVGTVAKFGAEVLGTTQASDKGFDIEIWNELSFGSYFLSINSYYEPKLYEYDQNSILGDLIKETAAYAEAHPDDFRGVQLTDGIANTIPWSASSTTPARIAAISKHPYSTTRQDYPKDDKGSSRINALYQEDKSGFVPTYSAVFPEYFATALQTETIVRDMGPITSDIQGVKHGRFAREINGKIVPTPVWITEVNMNPVEIDSNVTAERALQIKAKTTARYYCFFLNKGVTQLYLYSTAGEDKALAVVKENFLKYAQQPNATYPTDDTSYTSPALATLNRIITKMSQQLDSDLKDTRQLQVISLSDTHDHYQFKGRGTAEHPNLYDRDVFAFLPFQVNPKRFVIPYYVMTRDIMKDLPPEEFTLQIKGLVGEGASISAYDPINDRDVPVIINRKEADSLTLTLTATDYPYLLTVQESF